jgi:hypothetical protein
MIELTDNGYILGIWFSASKSGNDWMCIAQKDSLDDKWKIKYRWRTRMDEILGQGSNDKKSWRSLIAKGVMTEDQIIHLLNEMQDSIEDGYPEKDHVLIQGNPQKFIEIMKASKKPWLHIEEVPLDQIDKIRGTNKCH